MTAVFVIVVILLLGAASFIAVGRLGELPEAEPDVRPEGWRDDRAFDVVVRGYRMDEVDARIAQLEQEIDDLRGRA
jgi:hypothetical protein